MKQRICPHCKQQIEPDDPIVTIGEAEYHMVCWEEEEDEMEKDNLSDL